MASSALPILTLAVKQQQYSCHGCGNCCRDFTVQLRDDDRRRLDEQGWANKLGHPITVEFKLPNRSICAAPRNPMSMRPPWRK